MHNWTLTKASSTSDNSVSHLVSNSVFGCRIHDQVPITRLNICQTVFANFTNLLWAFELIEQFLKFGQRSRWVTQCALREQSWLNKKITSTYLNRYILNHLYWWVIFTTPSTIRCILKGMIRWRRREDLQCYVAEMRQGNCPKTVDSHIAMMLVGVMLMWRDNDIWEEATMAWVGFVGSKKILILDCLIIIAVWIKLWWGYLFPPLAHTSASRI